MENEENKNQTDLEREQRILCSDESCIGVIGPDGRCKECGLPHAGGPVENVEQAPVDADFEETVEDEDVDEDMEEFSADEDAETVTDLEWEQRILCSDESCIGVIGPDGRCKECGLPHAGGPVENIEQAPVDADFEETVEDEDADEDTEEFSADEDAEEFSADEDAEDFSADEDAETVTDLEWEQRILCSDESCIGVIGPDGRCKECGKPYDSK